MFIQIPENYSEVLTRLQQLRDAGDQKITEEDVAKQAVLDNFMVFLADAEEGQYDTAQWTDDGNLRVVDILGKQKMLVKPEGRSFVADFKEHTEQLFFYLNKKAYEAPLIS